MATITSQKLKRIHLFEFEDFKWFPNWIRICITRYIAAFHKLLGTSEILAGLVARALQRTEKAQILDLCSGSGGPIIEVAKILKEKHGFSHLQLSLSDLYPNLEAAQELNSNPDSSITYITKSVDATTVSSDFNGVRTMVCSMHHMKPAVAHQILKGAKEARNLFVFSRSAIMLHPFFYGG